MPYADLNDYKSHVQYKQLQGHKVAVWHHVNANPEAATLVFIHGFPSAAWDWHSQWQAFKSDYNLVALDLLGYGLSDKPHPHKYSLVEQADIIEQLLAELGLTQVSIVAHDYGDSVAQELLARVTLGAAGYTINHLIWLNGGLFPESHRPLITQKLLHSWVGPVLARLLSKATLKKSFTRIFGPQTPPKDNDIDVLWELMKHNRGRRVIPSMLDYLDDRIRYRDRWVSAMQEAAAQDTTKLMFINGTYDPISGQHMLSQFQQLLPKTPTKALPVGHYPQLEAPEDVNQIISEIISEK
ncbi:alpha/beta hydrolase [Alteromonas sp. ASW11-36]|uniref:Alpha/beta hydrolase n=1 Tax=Alteromonas arenosi TaxID=3055817 RepID=A0ABT7SVY2_9ALTE|nr:alpha/beta hydrolase [Alteromonas sp. ASW11-36]MDM7860326.1 alpha/beta hydrolase [Alteromonas sp. ASW11-36]